jgi:hypothetical protein
MTCSLWKKRSGFRMTRRILPKLQILEQDTDIQEGDEEDEDAPSGSKSAEEQ